MARLPYADEGNLPEETRALLDRLPARLHVFRMIAHAPTCFPGWLRLGTAILSELALAPSLRELMILLVARESGCTYEWQQHVPLARAVGVTEEQIRAIEAGDTAGTRFAPQERVLLAATREWLQQPKCADATWRELVAYFSPRQIVEAMLVAGFYSSLARILETTEVDLDEPFFTRDNAPSRE
jgi:AhpD family alkylhydroperoxidase